MITRQHAAQLFTWQSAGQIANEQASAGIFEDYAAGQSDNTLRRHRADLASFAKFLASADPSWPGGDLPTSASAWAGVTWGMVTLYRDWLLSASYAVGTINVRLSTVKTYAGLAAKSGVLSAEDLAMIQAVKGYNRKTARRVDGRRKATRRGCKKAGPVRLTDEQSDRLKSQPQTPQGRRDAVIVALLLDHGLRVGELARLTVDAVDLAGQTMTFYRPKVDKMQTHTLTADCLAALSAWLNTDAPGAGLLLRKSHNSGRLTSPGMSERSITAPVAVLGRAVGVLGLSAHDLRHKWATSAAWAGTDIFSLQEAGGWSSLAMPRRYVETTKIANAGVRLRAQ